jgi:hypothetical protein
MYVCVYVCMYVSLRYNLLQLQTAGLYPACTHTRIYIHTYIYLSGQLAADDCHCVYIYAYTHTYIYTYTHRYIHTYMYLSGQLAADDCHCVYIYAYTHTYIYIYIYIYTHTGTYIHTCTCLVNWQQVIAAVCPLHTDNCVPIASVQGRRQSHKRT